ncbi:MAG: 6,7-dimethyl-8-ribityllumazine synthase [Erythrobacter sp.]|nr:6,7-dimethyl-8-ribityllumazine synthase [Erythrobacter sp.]
MARFLIVEARFYDHLNDQLIAGARTALEADGHEIEVLTVPGALEIPGAIALAAESGRYDGFVAIGVVIRGETYHFEIVAGESARGIIIALQGTQNQLYRSFLIKCIKMVRYPRSRKCLHWR